MSNTRFTLNTKQAGDQLLRNNSRMQTIQDGAMNVVLGAVQAQFFQDFGVEGSFQVIGFTTDRSSVKIQAADKRTGGLLKTMPGWLDQFTNNIVI